MKKYCRHWLNVGNIASSADAACDIWRKSTNWPWTSTSVSQPKIWSKIRPSNDTSDCTCGFKNVSFFENWLSSIIVDSFFENAGIADTSTKQTTNQPIRFIFLPRTLTGSFMEQVEETKNIEEREKEREALNEREKLKGTKRNSKKKLKGDKNSFKMSLTHGRWMQIDGTYDGPRAFRWPVQFKLRIRFGTRRRNDSTSLCAWRVPVPYAADCLLHVVVKGLIFHQNWAHSQRLSKKNIGKR